MNLKPVSPDDLWKVIRHAEGETTRVLFETPSFEDAEKFRLFQIEYELGCVAFYNGFHGDTVALLEESPVGGEDYLQIAESIWIELIRPKGQ